MFSEQAVVYFSGSGMLGTVCFRNNPQNVEIESTIYNDWAVYTSLNDLMRSSNCSSF